MTLIERLQKEYQARRKEIQEGKFSDSKDLDQLATLERVDSLLTKTISSDTSFGSFLGKRGYDMNFYEGKSIYEVIESMNVENADKLIEIARYGLHLVSRKMNKKHGDKAAGILIYHMAVAKAFELGVYNKLTENAKNVRAEQNIIGKHQGEVWQARFEAFTGDSYVLPIMAEMLQRGQASIGNQGYKVPSPKENYSERSIVESIPKFSLVRV